MSEVRWHKLLKAVHDTASDVANQSGSAALKNAVRAATDKIAEHNALRSAHGAGPDHVLARTRNPNGYPKWTEIDGRPSIPTEGGINADDINAGTVGLPFYHPDVVLTDDPRLQGTPRLVGVALNAGHYVGVYIDGGVSKIRPAIASTSPIPAIGYVTTSAVPGDTVFVNEDGLNVFAVLTATAGDIADPVYLSPTTAGATTLTMPTTVGQIVQTLGAVHAADGSGTSTVDTNIGTPRLIGTDLDAYNGKVVNVATGIAGTDAVNKAQMDLAIAALGGSAIATGYVLLVDSKPSGTDGGTFTSGAWRTRTLNVKRADTAGICTLSSNEFTLPAGLYFIDASAEAYTVLRHQLRLYDVTNATVLASGTSAYAASGPISNRSFMSEPFTLIGTTTLRLEHRCETTAATVGFGIATGMAFAVSEELYSIVKITLF